MSKIAIALGVVVIAAGGGFAGARLTTPAAAAAPVAHVLDCSALRDPAARAACARLNVALADVAREADHCTSDAVAATASIDAVLANDVYRSLLKGEIPADVLKQLVLERQLEEIARRAQVMANTTRSMHESAQNVIRNMKG